MEVVTGRRTRRPPLGVLLVLVVGIIATTSSYLRAVGEQRQAMRAREVAVEALDDGLARRVPEARVRAVLDAVPDVLLEDPVSGDEMGAEEIRTRYFDVLRARLQAPRAWVDGVMDTHRERRAHPLHFTFATAG